MTNNLLTLENLTGTPTLLPLAQKDNQHSLFIIRGISGSGKSTLARCLWFNIINSRMFAADDWFDHLNNGVFEHSKLGQAHEWCREITRESLSKNYNVFVHNTFITESEVKPYVKIAEQLQVPYYILIADGDYQNVHQVPDNKNTERAKKFWFNNRFMRKA